MPSVQQKLLTQKVALVTGASSGVGRSIAVALADAGADIALLGRNLDVLTTVARRCRESGSRAFCFTVDLLSQDEIRKAASDVMDAFGNLDILIHGAGVIAPASAATASLNDFDMQHRCNVLAPFALTQYLLPALIDSRGDIVFINSTAGLVGAAGISQYSATKHALKAIADSLRDEVNSFGVRVLSVYLGRTATPMQAKVHEWEGMPYAPEHLIQPEQVSSVVINALLLGPEAEVTDLRIRPRRNLRNRQ
jgi:NADP-dependent 3-hydroxy acid dehydrogenase YdfG